MTAAIEVPGADEYAPYYATYVGRAPSGDVLATLEKQVGELDGLLRGLTDEQANSCFAPGEWSIKEVVGHLVDAERAFGYRAFAFSRGESAALPSFDQDAYVREAGFGARSLAALLDELTLLRRANLIAFTHLTPEAARRRGTASGQEVSVRALIYIIAGHVVYHLEDLREKYLPAVSR
jgi:hypothetical protein